MLVRRMKAPTRVTRSSSREVERLPLAAGKGAELKPGGLHLMLMGGKAALQAVGRAHCNAACNVIADLLRYLCHQSRAVMLDLNGIQQRRQLALFKFNIQHRAGDLYDPADVFFLHPLPSFLELMMHRPAVRRAAVNYISAPATISVISCVMAPCRARL